MSNYHSLKVELYKINFENIEKKYYARPATDRTLTALQLAEKAVKRGGATTSAEDMVRALNEFMKEATFQVCDGYAILTDYFKVWLKIEGTFADTADEFDSKEHKLSFGFQATSTMRSELEDISVDIDRLAEVGPVIVHVINNSDGQTNSTLTPGHAITIEGERIKISGDNAACGIYLIAEDGTETLINGSNILDNEPKRLVALVPSTLASGTYSIRITTQFCSSSYETQSPRSSSSDIELTVE